MTYEMKIAGLTRHLPLCRISDDLYIGAFVMLGDQEICFAGAALVHSSHYVVSTYFTFDNATTYIIQVMVGGVYNVVGVFFGTVLITMLPEWLRPLKSYLKIIYGVMLILLMTFMPTGVAGFVQSMKKKLVNRLKKRKEARGNAEAR